MQLSKILGAIVGSVVSYIFCANYFAFKHESQKIYFLTIAFLLFYWIIKGVSKNTDFMRFFKFLFLWIVIVAVVLGGVSYQYEIKQVANRMVANLIPSLGQGNGDGSVTFYANEDGHFTVKALVNDTQRIDFLVDTGASTVALTATDAKDLGIDVDNLNYNLMLNTANGIAWAARINLALVEVGPIKLKNVEASVSKTGLDTSLLGMSFLGRIKEFELKANQLTLKN